MCDTVCGLLPGQQRKARENTPRPEKYLRRRWRRHAPPRAARCHIPRCLPDAPVQCCLQLGSVPGGRHGPGPGRLRESRRGPFIEASCIVQPWHHGANGRARRRAASQHWHCAPKFGATLQLAQRCNAKHVLSQTLGGLHAPRPLAYAFFEVMWLNHHIGMRRSCCGGGLCVLTATSFTFLSTDRKRAIPREAVDHIFGSRRRRWQGVRGEGVHSESADEPGDERGVRKKLALLAEACAPRSGRECCPSSGCC